MTGAILAAMSGGRMGEAGSRVSSHVYSRRDLHWGDWMPEGSLQPDELPLFVSGIYEPVLRVVPDGAHPEMFRIRYQGGQVSDFGNLERIKDQACSAALAMLNTRYAGRSVA